MQKLWRALRIWIINYGEIIPIPFSIFAIVVVNKGGIGKSFIVSMLGFCLGADKSKVKLIDLDGGNATTRATNPDAEFVNFREEGRVVRGTLISSIEMIEKKEFKHGVVDLAAGDTKYFIRDLAKTVIANCLAAKAKVVFCCAITDDADTQRDAMEIAELAIKYKVACLFIINYGQGVDEDGMHNWLKSESRALAIQRGAVEVRVEDLKRSFSTIARGAKLSLTDIVAEDFSKVDDHKITDVINFFDANRQAYIADFIADHVDPIRRGIVQAIANVAR